MARMTHGKPEQGVGELLAHPCRNFNILGATTLRDPKSSKRESTGQDIGETVVLSNFAAGATGNLIFIDPESGTSEAIELPADDGAWALHNLDDRVLLVGTCPTGGYLHALELVERRWRTPLRDSHETYIWNLCRGDDGYIYGGTYPGCVLLRYDPRTHRLENVGRASSNADNLYSRYVYAEIPGHILIACGMAEMHLSLYNLESGKFSRFGPDKAQVKHITPDHLWVETPDARYCYTTASIAQGDPVEVSLDQMPVPQPLPQPYAGIRHDLEMVASGKRFAVRGQEYFVAPIQTEPYQQPPPLIDIPTPRPPTRIHTLISDAQGTLWGSSGFGQTIFSYNPQTDSTWNSNTVCDSGGEVYGMAFKDERLFLAAYSGGDHIVYDPSQPWDQVSNHNPRTLQSAAPAHIRPEGRSIIGPDGNFWTGWMARYGVYGGAISRVHTETLRVSLWEDFTSQQPVMALSADDRYLYITTGGAGNGLPPKTEPFTFAVLICPKDDASPETAPALVHAHQFPSGRKPGRIATRVNTNREEAKQTVSHSVMVAVDDELWPFDPQQLVWGDPMQMDAPIGCLLTLANSDCLIFTGESLWRQTPDYCTRVGNLPGPVQTATQTPDGSVYFAVGTGLYRLNA